MKVYYDFHIHSCLSPCGDNDNTPNNIAGMAHIKGLDAIAITDHNSFKNTFATYEVCHRYGITMLFGAEVTTSEDIHMVCLFEDYQSANTFQNFLHNNMNFIQNDEDIFGQQIIMDCNDKIVGYEKGLLIFASNLSVDDVCENVNNLGGVCFAAHIDKQANSIVGILGEIPSDTKISCVEISKNAPSGFTSYGYAVLKNSDAHYLHDISERINFIEIEENSARCIMNYLKSCTKIID